MKAPKTEPSTNGDSTASLAEEVRRTPELFDEVGDTEFDTECGLICSGDAA